MAKFDGIILDLDGTLWDASQASAAAWNKIALEVGHSSKITSQDIQAVSGLPFDKCVETLFGKPKPKELVIRLDEEEKEQIQRGGWSLFPGVQEALDRLKQKAPLFIVSNCQDWYLDFFLQTSGLGDYFNDSLSHGGSGLTKSQMIEKIKFNHNLKSALYVGDTHWDQIAAYQARCSFAFANWGFGKPQVSCPKFESMEQLYHFVIAKQSDEIDVKQLEPSEYDQAQRFYEQVGYRHRITPIAKVVVASDKNRIVGVVRLEEEHGILVLRGMQVEALYQFSGVGLRMLRILTSFIDEDCYCMPFSWLEYFYGKIGFKKLASPDDAPYFLKERLLENQIRHPHLTLMKRTL